MDPLLLNYYERELQFIREMGAEYASEYPKIAGRLGMDGAETSDPYVERLLEGFAFLSARVHLRLDAEYPRFTQNLLNIVYPQYLTPTPSMALVHIQPAANASLDEGFEIPKAAAMRGNLQKGEQTACEFRTAHDLTLWPVAITEAEYFSNIGVYAASSSTGAKVRAGLKLSLSSNNGQPLNEIDMDELTVFLAGQPSQAMRLYEQIFGNACGFIIQSADKNNHWEEKLSVDLIQQTGFSDAQSLLPEDARTFSGYRLLREYFAFPERFLFAKFCQIRQALSRCAADKIDIVVLFDRYDPELENRVTATDFKLHCTPAINLFPRRVDRIHVAAKDHEYHVVVDRTRPIDFEIFSIEGLIGHGTGVEECKDFLPFYQSNDLTQHLGHEAYFTLRRERRMLSSKQKNRGARSTYWGSEAYISLVDSNEAPFSTHLKQLEVKALCTNRDLPLRMPLGKSASDFSLDSGAPVDSVNCIGSLSRPKPSLAHNDGEIAWRLINQLSLNYLSLTGAGSEGDTSAIRELLVLYVDKKDAAQMKQIEGITGISSEQVTRRIPIPGPIAFGRGLKIEITFDESAFVGTGIFLLGSVLERFFARYVSINSFTETVIKSEDRGEVMVWPVRIGQRQII